MLALALVQPRAKCAWLCKAWEANTLGSAESETAEAEKEICRLVIFDAGRRRVCSNSSSGSRVVLRYLEFLRSNQHPRTAHTAGAGRCAAGISLARLERAARHSRSCSISAWFSKLLSVAPRLAGPGEFAAPSISVGISTGFRTAGSNKIFLRLLQLRRAGGTSSVLGPRAEASWKLVEARRAGENGFKTARGPKPQAPKPLHQSP